MHGEVGSVERILRDPMPEGLDVIMSYEIVAQIVLIALRKEE